MVAELAISPPQRQTRRLRIRFSDELVENRQAIDRYLVHSKYQVKQMRSVFVNNKKNTTLKVLETSKVQFYLDEKDKLCLLLAQHITQKRIKWISDNGMILPIMLRQFNLTEGELQKYLESFGEWGYKTFWYLRTVSCS